MGVGFVNSLGRWVLEAEQIKDEAIPAAAKPSKIGKGVRRKTSISQQTSMICTNSLSSKLIHKTTPPQSPPTHNLSLTFPQDGSHSSKSAIPVRILAGEAQHATIHHKLQYGNHLYQPFTRSCLISPFSNTLSHSISNRWKPNSFPLFSRSVRNYSTFAPSILVKRTLAHNNNSTVTVFEGPLQKDGEDISEQDLDSQEESHMLRIRQLRFDTTVQATVVYNATEQASFELPWNTINYSPFCL